MPLSLQDIDKNLRQQRQVPEDTVFRSALESPFDLYGMNGLETPLCRIPKELVEISNEGVQFLAYNTAGGRIRFTTDASSIHIAFRLTGPCTFPHMPLSGSSSVDVYADGIFSGVVRAEFAPDGTPSVEALGSVALPGAGIKDVEIFLPLYNGIEAISVGTAPGAFIGHGGSYRLDKPILFYGSSITQGGCSCRPSTCYTAAVSRLLNVDHVNLGFSGSARGEQSMAEYIASLPMAAFILDYDHNAPNPEHLWATHEAFYKTVREKQPELPILLLSKPDYLPERAEDNERLRCVRTTYEHALAAGDRNIYFIPGSELMAGTERSSCTVDGCHPNDLGFYRMTMKVEPLLRKILFPED